MDVDTYLTGLEEFITSGNSVGGGMSSGLLMDFLCILASSGLVDKSRADTSSLFSVVSAIVSWNSLQEPHKMRC